VLHDGDQVFTNISIKCRGRMRLVIITTINYATYVVGREITVPRMEDHSCYEGGSFMLHAVGRSGRYVRIYLLYYIYIYINIYIFRVGHVIFSRIVYIFKQMTKLSMQLLTSSLNNCRRHHWTMTNISSRLIDFRLIIPNKSILVLGKNLLIFYLGWVSGRRSWFGKVPLLTCPCCLPIAFE